MHITHAVIKKFMFTRIDLSIHTQGKNNMPN